MINKNCKRCLLSEISSTAFKSVFEYIKSLDDDIKTDDITYSLRLTICKNCDDLVNGMCRYCGCFVEVRAIKKQNHCPHLDKKW